LKRRPTSRRNETSPQKLPVDLPTTRLGVIRDALGDRSCLLPAIADERNEEDESDASQCEDAGFGDFGHRQLTAGL
jgi:hypothetical protein